MHQDLSNQRLKRASISALAAVAICAVLAALPNLLHVQNGSTFDNLERTRLVSFLALALPGLFITLMLGCLAKRWVPRFSMGVTWAATALLAVGLPAPAIVSNRWADSWLLGYLACGLVAGAAWGWSAPKTAAPADDDHKQP